MAARPLINVKNIRIIYNVNKLYVRKSFFSSQNIFDKQKGIIKSPYPDLLIPNCSLPDLIFHSLRRNGERIAIIDAIKNEKWTYSNLLDKTIKTAVAFKQKLHMKSGDVAVIISNNSPEYCYVYLALLAIGVIPSALNPAITQKELQHVCNTINGKYFFTSKNLSKSFKIYNTKFISLDGNIEGCIDLKELIESSNCIKDFNENWSEVKSTNDTAAIPFSSGTSGLPKGVELTHSNIVSNIHQIINPFTNLDKILTNKLSLFVLPMFHIYGQVVIFLNCIFSSGTVVILPKFEPESFFNCLNKHKPSCIFVVPPLLNFLSRELDRCPDFTKFVELVYTGAAPLSEIICENFKRKLNFDKIINSYGLTETSPITHINPFHALTYDTVGVPIPNTLCKLINPETNEVITEFEKEGELCIKGPQVMKGYFKNREETEKVLRDGWLFSGDVGMVKKNGSYFKVTDRLKEIIKYKGFQVTPAELENILLGNEYVLDAAVVGKKDEIAGELPFAFVVLKKEFQNENHKDISAKIRNYVKEQVSNQKQLRGGVVFIDDIPKSPSGKILRRILRNKIN